MSDPIYVLLYEHKHGTDVSLYRTLELAQDSATVIILDRVEEELWDREDAEKLKSMINFEDMLSFFHDQELNFRYPESIEIWPREVYGDEDRVHRDKKGDDPKTEGSSEADTGSAGSQ